MVVFLDGDYSDRPSGLPMILAPIIRGSADITLGSRLSGKNNPGALPWHQSFGNRLAAGLIRPSYGLSIRDLGPFRAGRADVLRALALEEATYGWAVEMILKGALAGFRIVAVPVSYYPRIGKSKIGGTEGDNRGDVVHPEPDRALLFATAKSGNTATNVMANGPISHGTS